MTLAQYLNQPLPEAYPHVLLTENEFRLESVCNLPEEEQALVTVKHYPEYQYMTRGNSGQLWFVKDGKPTAPSCFFIH